MKKLALGLLSAVLVLTLAACANGSGAEVGAKTTYALADINDFGISGTVTFEKVSETETKIDIALDGTPEGGSHPAHIHVGDADPGGAIYVTLGTVDGDTGTSTITVTETDERNAVTYDDLIDYDGYVNVHLSAEELGTIVAQGETGAGATAEED